MIYFFCLIALAVIAGIIFALKPLFANDSANTPSSPEPNPAIPPPTVNPPGKKNSMARESAASILDRFQPPNSTTHLKTPNKNSDHNLQEIINAAKIVPTHSTEKTIPISLKGNPHDPNTINSPLFNPVTSQSPDPNNSTPSVIIHELKEKNEKIEKLLTEKSQEIEKLNQSILGEQTARKDFEKIKNLLEQELLGIKDKNKMTQSQLTNTQLDMQKLKDQFVEIEKQNQALTHRLAIYEEHIKEKDQRITELLTGNQKNSLEANRNTEEIIKLAPDILSTENNIDLRANPENKPNPQ